MRTFIDDACWNFYHIRGDVQGEAGPVVATYDVTFGVERAFEVYIFLLDYDAPYARIVVYKGDDEAAAALVFDAYCERLLEFAASPGDRSDFSQDVEAWRRVHWSIMSYGTDGPVISATRVQSEPPRTGESAFEVWVEVRGFAVECIEGSPDDSPLRIILGDD